MPPGLPLCTARGGFLWLCLNLLVLRPHFRRVNVGSFESWRCLTPGPDGSSSSLSSARPTVARNRSRTARLEVIIASPGSAGTTSLAAALEVLGLRTYKYDDALFYMPEVLDPDLPVEDLRGLLESCAVRAFAPEPLLKVVPKLVEAAGPGVRIILTKRAWSDWAESYKRSHARLPVAVVAKYITAQVFCHWLPWGALFHMDDALLESAERGEERVQSSSGGGLPFLGTDRLHSFWTSRVTGPLLDLCVVPFRPFPRELKPHLGPSTSLQAGQQSVKGWRISFDGGGMLGNESTYEDYFSRVAALVPSDQLLNFDLRAHGWRDLAEFLGVPAPTAPMPFPVLGSKYGLPGITMVQLYPSKYVAVWAMLLASIAVNWALFAMTLARGAALIAGARRQCCEACWWPSWLGGPDYC